MALITILAGHPYFECEQPVVWQMPNSKWTVRWRDFHTIKQDRDFDTEQQARAFASTLCRPPLTVDDDACDLASSHAFWAELAEDLRKKVPKFTADWRVEEVVARCAGVAGIDRPNSFSDYLLAELWETGFAVVPREPR